MGHLLVNRPDPLVKMASLTKRLICWPITPTCWPSENSWSMGHNSTALAGAAARGHEEMVELLLKHNARTNTESEDYGTPSIAAAHEGHEMIVEMLLKNSPDIDANSQNYGTALEAAVSRGRKEIVKLLLNRNADVNAGRRRRALERRARLPNQHVRETMWWEG